MAYLTLADLKSYLGLTNTTDDILLTDLLAAAQTAIDSYCDRTFEATSDTNRAFYAMEAAKGQLLYLDTDLAQITSVTNGDLSATILAPSSYRLLPPDPPYRALLLEEDTSVTWEGIITISGRWAYSITAPIGVIQATREYAAYLYRTADLQADRQLVQINNGQPHHIKQLLAGYRRLR